MAASRAAMVIYGMKGNTMKKIVAVAAFACHASAASAQTPQPADWVTLSFSADLNKNIDVAWERVGGNELCAIARYLDIQGCTPVSGKGELGSVRNIAVAGNPAPIVENIVARSKYAYTYAQPFTPIFYHGTMSIEATGANRSRLHYTLIWNQRAVGDAAAQAAARTSRQQRFQAAVDKMAAAANAP
jgi:hypothetical protein